MLRDRLGRVFGGYFAGNLARFVLATLLGMVVVTAIAVVLNPPSSSMGADVALAAYVFLVIYGLVVGVPVAVALLFAIQRWPGLATTRPRLIATSVAAGLLAGLLTVGLGVTALLFAIPWLVFGVILRHPSLAPVRGATA